MQLGMKILILAQLVIVQEAKAVPKAEELSPCFGLRKLTGTQFSQLSSTESVPHTS